MAIAIIVYDPNITNWRGHCAAAIAQSGSNSFKKRDMIRILPTSITYDQYVGVVGILNSDSDELILLEAFFE